MCRLFLSAYRKLAHASQLQAAQHDLWVVLSEWAIALRVHAASKIAEGGSMLVSTAEGTGAQFLVLLRR